jgi:hypothetical protein
VKSGVRGSFVNFTVLAVVSIFALTAGEYAVRYVPRSGEGYIRGFHKPDAELGWVLSPNVRFLHKTAEGAIDVRYSSGGWRDGEFSLEPPVGVFRVAVLGDSFMEAYSVELEDSFHRRLQAAFEEQGRRVEVMNFGVAGYATLQEYLVYLRNVRAYSPDLVVLAFFVANDVNGNSLELERSVHTGVQKLLSRPFLEDGGGWRTMQVDHELSERIFASHLGRSPAPYSMSARRSLLVREFFYRTVPLRRRLFGAPPPAVPVPPEFQPRHDVSLHVVHACREPAAVTRAWEATAKILARLRDAVRADGAEFAVFDVPAWEEVDPVRSREVTERDVELTDLCLADAPGHERLFSILIELGIPAIDLLPHFRKALRSEGAGLFLTDEHWSEAGHELAAGLVADGLAARGLVPETGDAGTAPGVTLAGR